MKVDNERLEELKTLRTKAISFVLFLFLVVVSSIFIIKTSIIKPTDKVIEVFDYNINNNIQYKVYLDENNPLFEDKVLGMNRLYAADSIENIEIDFTNMLNISKPAVIDYDYQIKAQINGLYTSDSSNKNKELWGRKFVLLPRESAIIDKNNNHRINKKINVDYAYYNQLVLDFKREMKVNLDAELVITMTINYKLKVDDEILDKSQDLIVSFPLSKVAFEITTKIPDKVNETFYANGDLIIQYFFLAPAIMFLFIALILVINFIKKIIRLNYKTEYTAKLNKILKSFGEVIAESESLPNYTKYDVLDISNFEDLLDIQNEVRIPIIYHERVRDTEGWFTILHGETLYRYVLYVKKPVVKKYKHSKQ